MLRMTYDRTHALVRVSDNERTGSTNDNTTTHTSDDPAEPQHQTGRFCGGMTYDWTHALV